MAERPTKSRLWAMLASLGPKSKEPANARVLNDWIARAERELGDEARGGRLGWLVASSVAIAAVQRAIDDNGRRLFLLKGGTLLQHQLAATARATKDVDGLVRGDIDEFLRSLDDAFREPWGTITLRRGLVETIEVPGRLVKPRRFDVILELRGVTWRRIQFEISGDEAGIGDDEEIIVPPPLDGFGLPSAEAIVGIAPRFQIAQKLHAVSDPHDPPNFLNDRARDVVDLILLRDLAIAIGHPNHAAIRRAAMAVFDGRADEARSVGRPARLWPPTVIALPHWRGDYERAAASGGVDLSLGEAVVVVNEWIAQIDNAAAPRD